MGGTCCKHDAGAAEVLLSGSGAAPAAAPVAAALSYGDKVGDDGHVAKPETYAAEVLLTEASATVAAAPAAPPPPPMAAPSSSDEDDGRYTKPETHFALASTGDVALLSYLWLEARAERGAPLPRRK